MSHYDHTVPTQDYIFLIFGILSNWFYGESNHKEEEYFNNVFSQTFFVSFRVGLFFHNHNYGKWWDNFHSPVLFYVPGDSSSFLFGLQNFRITLIIRIGWHCKQNPATTSIDSSVVVRILLTFHRGSLI